MKEINKITLLSKEQVENLEIFKKIYKPCAVTDFAILLGANVSYMYYTNMNDYNKDRCGWWYLSSMTYKNVYSVYYAGDVVSVDASFRNGGIRPVIKINDKSILWHATKNKNEVLELEYGEYPQYVVDEPVHLMLESLYQKGLFKLLKKTGKEYTTDSNRCDAYDNYFRPQKLIEYEYEDKKYVRVLSNNKGYSLSNGKAVNLGDVAWVEVEPLKWFVDEKENLLISKNLVASGVRFCNSTAYDGNFSYTEMFEFLNNYFVKDIIPLKNKKIIKKMENLNPYNLKFNEVSEEDIIRGAIESNISVFLHGLSSDGKSSRVKQIDPTCEILYLCNQTPESLNGKSVYNSNTGEMIDIKPTWLKRIEEKCLKEPEKLHILFFDELTNALPSIQGIAFNIILDKEVNGIWKLPENVRIVAAGNDMKDSLAANQLAEPLFNRFAHVYIKTTLNSWLKWAKENKIHPAIYSYIAYKNGEVLRSEYDGEKPNADPRKWEMASKMLYKTGNPEMLRALVGEDITREFVTFCNQKVIRLQDVINENYDLEEINELNTAEKYATTTGLTLVNIDNIEIVRNFVKILGEEFVSIFDSLWINDDEKLEKIAELKLSESKAKSYGR